MNAIDIVFFGIGGYFVVRGLMRGLTGELLSLLGIVGGFYCSMAYSVPLSRLIFPRDSVNPLLAAAVSIVLIYAAALILCSVLDNQTRKLLKITRLSRLNTIMGGIAGFLKTYLVVLTTLVAAVIYVAVFPRADIGWIHNSIILTTCARTLPVVYPLLEEHGLAPNIDDMRRDAAEFLAERSLDALSGTTASMEIIPADGAKDEPDGAASNDEQAASPDRTKESTSRAVIRRFLGFGTTDAKVGDKEERREDTKE